MHIHQDHQDNQGVPQDGPSIEDIMGEDFVRRMDRLAGLLNDPQFQADMTTFFHGALKLVKTINGVINDLDPDPDPDFGDFEVPGEGPETVSGPCGCVG